MKTTKILISTFCAAALAIAFAGCNKTTEATSNQSAAATQANNTNTANAAKTEPTKKAAPTATPAVAASDIKSIDFLNFTYESTSCAEDLGIDQKIKVGKGKFKDGDNYFNVKDNNFMYADANGDGREDAVVTLECGNSAGTFRSFEIHAFSFENNQAKRFAALDFNQVSEDYTKHFPEGFVFGIPQNGVTVDNDAALVVDVMTDGSFAMPKNVSTFIYKLRGGKFTLTAKPAKRSYKP